jgi:FkbM family methyltransferase
MIRRLLGFVNQILDRTFGLRIQPSADKRLANARNSILSLTDTKLVLDVGANQGQWASRIRKDGYKYQIISFEPSEAFNELFIRAESDSNWDCQKLAVSNNNGEVILFSASNGNLSTSILKPKEILNQGFNLKFETKVMAQAITLEKFLSTHQQSPYYLKLDVQGAEMKVLQGAKKVLEKCVAVEFESALVDLYEGETTHYKIAEWLRQYDFEPWQIAITHWDEKLRTISIDSIFINYRNFDTENKKVESRRI